MDTRHNPEFTTVEMYQAYTDYQGMMDLIESLFQYVAQEACGTTSLTYQGQPIQLGGRWARMTMAEAVKKYSGLDYDAWADDASARAALSEAGYAVDKAFSRGDCLNFLFEATVEDHLIQPTFIYDYPIEVSPLAKRTPYDNRLTERFEIFMTGREMGNAFTELNDPIDQRQRFVEQAKKKYIEGEFEIDEDFVTAMEYGMPPTGGMGLGIDRMVMLFTDSASIRDVLFFPTMKPRGGQTGDDGEG
jgi:lysyl-tRNA synthetase class 2